MTATMMTGVIRLVHMDANDIPLNVILEKPTAELGAGGVAGTPASDPQKMTTIKRGECPVIAEDEKLVIQFKPDTTVTEASSANAHTKTYRIPVTYRNLRTKQTSEKTFTSGNFTTGRASAASQVWTSGQWYNLDSYTVTAQSAIVLGNSIQDARVDGKIALQMDVVT